jgi:hypothetical protein
MHADDSVSAELDAVDPQKLDPLGVGDRPDPDLFIRMLFEPDAIAVGDRVEAGARRTTRLVCQLSIDELRTTVRAGWQSEHGCVPSVFGGLGIRAVPLDGVAGLGPGILDFKRLDVAEMLIAPVMPTRAPAPVLLAVVDADRAAQAAPKPARGGVIPPRLTQGDPRGVLLKCRGQLQIGIHLGADAAEHHRVDGGVPLPQHTCRWVITRTAGGVQYR